MSMKLALADATLAILLVACGARDLRDPGERSRANEVVDLVEAGVIATPGLDFEEQVLLPPQYADLSASGTIAVSQPAVAGSLFVTFYVDADGAAPNRDRTFVYSSSGNFSVLERDAWQVERLDDHWFYVRFRGLARDSSPPGDDFP